MTLEIIVIALGKSIMEPLPSSWGTLGATREHKDSILLDL